MLKLLLMKSKKDCLKKDLNLRGKEGYGEAKWVLLDFYDVVVVTYFTALRESIT
jgi:ribosomal silencing factor RsfS